MRTVAPLLAAVIGAGGIAVLDAGSALAQSARLPGPLHYESGGHLFDWKSGPDVGARTDSGSATWLLSATHECGRIERVA